MRTFWMVAVNGNDNIMNATYINPKYSIYIKAVFNKTIKWGEYTVKPIILCEEVPYLVDLDMKTESVEGKTFEEFISYIDDRLENLEVCDYFASGKKIVSWPKYQLEFSWTSNSEHFTDILIEFKSDYSRERYNATAVSIILEDCIENGNNRCRATFYQDDGSFEDHVTCIEVEKSWKVEQ